MTTTTPRPSIQTAWNDAGLLREYAIDRFGYVYEHGAPYAVWQRAHRIAKRIAKLAGRSEEEVWDDLRADYLAHEQEG